jgi:hypothetical protein
VGVLEMIQDAVDRAHLSAEPTEVPAVFGSIDEVVAKSFSAGSVFQRILDKADRIWSKAICLFVGVDEIGPVDITIVFLAQLKNIVRCQNACRVNV